MKSFLEHVTGSVRNSLRSKQVSLIELPLFPLGTVLFPGGTMALKIFEQRYFSMAKNCLKNDLPFGIALIREGSEVGTPAVPETVGTFASVTDWDMQNLGVLQLRVKGGGRFKILSRSISKEGLIVGQVSTIPDDVHADCAEHAACGDFLRKVFRQIGNRDAATELHFDDAGWVGYRLTELLPFNGAVKQKMLELTDSRIRLEILHRFLVDQRLIG